MPETRHRVKATEMAKRLTQEEMEVIQQKMAADQARLHAESEALHRQRTEFEREMENSRRELRAEREELDERARETKDDKSQNPPDFENTNRTFSQTPLPTTAHVYGGYPPMARNEFDFSIGPKVSYREATEGVPTFDGYNPPLSQFARACRRALEIIPPAAERNLTRILINKLRGRAISAVEDEPCDSVSQLIDLLTGAFSSHRTIDQYRGELSSIFMRPREHVLDYISRVKDLRIAIIDTERQIKGLTDPRFCADIDGLTIRAFYEGLPLEYRMFMKPEVYGQPSEAFTDAKAAAKRIELEKQRHGSGTGRREYSVNPIGNPLAHSTPHRSTNQYREQRPSAAPPNNYNYNNRSNNYNYNRANNYDNRGNNYANRANNYENRANNYDNRANNYNRNNAGQYSPRPRENYNAPRATETRRAERAYNGTMPEANQRQTQNKFCRYCKVPGHEASECRKHLYNNPQPGNAYRASGPADANRQNSPQNTRPVNPIVAETRQEMADESESLS